MVASKLQTSRAKGLSASLGAQQPLPVQHRRSMCRVVAHATRAVAVDAAVDAAPKQSKCPFAGLASFLPHETVRAPPTPVTKAGGPAFSNPHLWLAAGMPGQNIPNRLVSGLRKLDLKEFLIELPHEMPHELGLKKRALADPARRRECIACEPSSLLAQWELLEVFLEHLPSHFPNLYTVRGEGDDRTVEVHPTGDVYRVSDYVECPLELCNLIVQEDLVLCRPDPPEGVDMNALPKGAAVPHVMSAAVVVFSFNDLPQKLSQPLQFIHAPVPGFEDQLLPLVAKTFTAITPATPLWRNNWAFADNGDLDRPVYGSDDAAASRLAAAGLAPEQRWLKTEYQTLRRLPASGHVLFTVRTFVEPLPDIAAAPGAAEALAGSIRCLTPAMLAYKGLPTEEAVGKVVEYLDGLAAADEAAKGA